MENKNTVRDQAIIEVKNVRKVYGKSEMRTEALKNVQFQVNRGEFIAIMGESGSGKTTLLNIIATIDTPTEGKVYIEGRDVAGMKGKEISEFRRDRLGFVFQEFNLLDTFHAKDNALLPLVLAGAEVEKMERRVEEVFEMLGIREHMLKYPYQLSGGQKQRVAIARAIMADPTVLLADEPTGALDSASSDSLLKTLEEINRRGQTILMVTHSVLAASVASRVLFIRDGKVFHEIYKGALRKEEFIEKIYQAQTLLFGRGV